MRRLGLLVLLWLGGCDESHCPPSGPSIIIDASVPDGACVNDPFDPAFPSVPDACPRTSGGQGISGCLLLPAGSGGTVECFYNGPACPL